MVAAKSLALAVALLGSASAFGPIAAPATLARRAVRVSSMMSEAPADLAEAVSVAETAAAEEPAAAEAEEPAAPEPAATPAAPPAPRKSMAIPFMMAPAQLDGTMAGDFGFDPLKFADSPENLMVYREAEIKHARLAMLAAAGWPLAELFQPALSKDFGLPSLLSQAGRSPSVLNGGLGQAPVLVFVLAAFAAIGTVESMTLQKQYISPSDYDRREEVFATKKQMGVTPGIFGFDPFNLYGFYGDSDAGRFQMQTAEIKNGRLAMLAITGFAVQEAVMHVPVVQQTPLFFTPFTQIVADLMMKY